MNRQVWVDAQAKVVAAVRAMEDRISKVDPVTGTEYVMVKFDAAKPLCTLTDEAMARLTREPYLVVGLRADGNTGFVETYPSPPEQEENWIHLDPFTACLVRPSRNYVALDDRLYSLFFTPLPTDLADLRTAADVAFLQDRDTEADQIITQIEQTCKERGIDITQLSL